MLKSIMSTTSMLTTTTIFISLLFMLSLSFHAKIISAVMIPNDGKNKAGDANQYSKEFFQDHEQFKEIYPILAKMILSVAQPVLIATGIQSAEDVSLVDVGCGHGLLVEAFRTFGLVESYCVEGAPEAQQQWPDEFRSYYTLQDLSIPDEAVKVIPSTKIVVSFEVGEHLPSSISDQFVQLLTHHQPDVIIFGAATLFQDRGQNPSHVNEQPLSFWVDKFQNVGGYHFSGVSTAKLRHLLLADKTFQQYFSKAWWYVKNAMVFVNPKVLPHDYIHQEYKSVPSNLDIGNSFYSDLGFNAGNEFGHMWKRDWMEFFNLYQAAQVQTRDESFRNFVKNELSSQKYPEATVQSEMFPKTKVASKKKN